MLVRDPRQLDDDDDDDDDDNNVYSYTRTVQLTSLGCFIYVSC